MSQIYYTPQAKIQFSELEIKKSRFLAYAQKSSDREQAMSFLAEVKKQYPDARHHCWAYLIGNPYCASSAAMSDDGEPSGTAGKPILNVIQHKKIGDIMLIVVRYFGGIKLGAGGLTRAYSAAAEQLLSQLETEQYIPHCVYQLNLSFAQEHKLRHWLGLHQGNIQDLHYTSQEIQVQVSLPSSLQSTLIDFCQSQGMVYQTTC